MTNAVVRLRAPLDRTIAESAQKPSFVGGRSSSPAEMLVLLKALGKEADGKQRHCRKWACGNGGNHPPAIKLSLGGRWFAVTGNRLPDSPASLATIPAVRIAKPSPARLDLVLDTDEKPPAEVRRQVLRNDRIRAGGKRPLGRRSAE
jgi:hypothetical protein